MRRASIVCTLSCLLLAACGGSDAPSPDGADGSGAADSGSSKHHDASVGTVDASGGDDDDDDDASVAADGGDAGADGADGADGTGAQDGASVDAAADAGKEAGAPDSGLPLPLGQCTGTFGRGLTNTYGRIDGVLQAYVKPTATSCPDADSTHLILQIAMKGSIYEIAVNVLSSDDSDVLYTTVDEALPGPAYSEGWHTGVTLDYPSTLGVHASQFTAYAEPDLVNVIDAQLTDGMPITVYGHGYTTGAHDTHYYGGGADGAIVLDPTAATPHWLLFHFDEQTF